MNRKYNFNPGILNNVGILCNIFQATSLCHCERINIFDMKKENDKIFFLPVFAFIGSGGYDKLKINFAQPNINVLQKVSQLKGGPGRKFLETLF